MHRTVFLSALTALFVSMPLSAHHGFGGRYDAGQPVAIAGIVERVTFGAPHSTLVLRIDSAFTEKIPSLDGLPAPSPSFRSAYAPVLIAGQRVSLEFPPIGVFNALDTRVRLGDRVELVALRNCDPPHQWRIQWFQPAQGAPAARSGRVQTEVSQC
jgi:Family of unknown function (DUF6152)